MNIQTRTPGGRPPRDRLPLQHLAKLRIQCLIVCPPSSSLVTSQTATSFTLVLTICFALITFMLDGSEWIDYAAAASGLFWSIYELLFSSFRQIFAKKILQTNFSRRYMGFNHPDSKIWWIVSFQLQVQLSVLLISIFLHFFLACWKYFWNSYRTWKPLPHWKVSRTSQSARWPSYFRICYWHNSHGGRKISKIPPSK